MNTGKPSGEWDFERWAREFEIRATKDLYASGSWKRLIKLGFDKRLIAWGFYLACDFPSSPGYEALAEMRDESKRKAVQARRLIARLETDRKELCNLLGITIASVPPNPPETLPSEPEDASGLVARVRARFPWNAGKAVEQNTEEPQASNSNQTHSPDPSKSGSKWLPKAAAVSPDSETITQAFDLAIGKLWLLQDEMRRYASKRTAKPSFFLALGITFIKETAGQPIYRDYANLLNVACQVFGHEELLVGEDAVRKTFQRFMKRNPDAFNFELSTEALLILAILLIARYSLDNPHPSGIGDRTL
jgi:hypothetical protein